MEQRARISGPAGVLLLATLAASLPAFAQLPPPTPRHQQVPVVLVPKPVVDPATRCGVFVPPAIVQALPHLKWSGDCRNGLAEGRGTATFAATAGAAAQKVQRGNFRNGFFLGEASVPAAIIAISPHLAGIELPHEAPQEGRVWLRAILATDGAPLPLCPAGTAEVSIETPSAIAASDEPRMRRVMQLAVIAYRKACPAPRGVRLAVFTGGFYKPTLTARAGLAEGAAPEALYSFQNLAAGDGSSASPTRMQEERRQDRVADSRRNWQDFTRANAVAVWATPRQLFISAPDYQDKVVAFPAHFLRVVAGGAVILRDRSGGMVMVNGLPEHLQQRGYGIVVAGRFQGRQAVPNATGELGVVAATAWKLCQRPDCGDYVEWTDEDKSFSWGADHSRFLR